MWHHANLLTEALSSSSPSSMAVLELWRLSPCVPSPRRQPIWFLVPSANESYPHSVECYTNQEEKNENYKSATRWKQTLFDEKIEIGNVNFVQKKLSITFGVICQLFQSDIQWFINLL